MKRNNDNGQLRKEEVEALDDEEEENRHANEGFQRASSTVLATRKIVKINRPLSAVSAVQPFPIAPIALSTATTSNSDGSAAKNLFANVQLKPSSTTVNPFANVQLKPTNPPPPLISSTALTANAFAGFKGFTSNSNSEPIKSTSEAFKPFQPFSSTVTEAFKQPSQPFSSTVIEAFKQPSQPFSSAITEAFKQPSQPFLSTVTEAFKQPSHPFSSNVTEAFKQPSQPFSSSAIVPVKPSIFSSSSGPLKESDRMKKIKKLNSSFLAWADKQSQHQCFSVWKEGVKDYIKHYQTTCDKYPKTSEDEAYEEGRSDQSAGVASQTTKASEPTSDKDKPKDMTSSSSSSSTTAAPFSFNPMKSDGADVVPVSLPAANTIKPLSTFSFNPTSSVSTASSSAAPFSFGNSSFSSSMKAPSGAVGAVSGSSFSFSVPSIGGFSVPSAGALNVFQTSSNNAIVNVNGDGDDDEGEPILEPEKVHRNADDTDEILHEVKCKLFSYSKEDNEWKDIGLGSFRITKDASVGGTNKKKRMLVRNPIGKITLNASFFSKMKIEKMKKGLRFSVVVAVESSKSNTTEVRTELRSYMLQLSSGDVQATLTKMEECISELASK